MARGYPDYSNPTYEIAARGVDIGILLLAISGLNSLDGLGRIWSIDNFADGLDVWRVLAGGDGIAPLVTTTQPEASPASVQMDAGSVAGAGWSLLFSERLINGLMNVGIQHSWLYENTRPTLLTSLNYTYAGAGLTGQLVVDALTGNVVLGHAGGDTVLTNLGLPAAVGSWLTLKMAVDFGAGRFLRVAVGQTVFDVSAYNLIPVAGTNEGVLETSFYANPDITTALPGHIGHVIYSLDEP